MAAAVANVVCSLTYRDGHSNKACCLHLALLNERSNLNISLLRQILLF
jgi:hypothetical protein